MYTAMQCLVLKDCNIRWKQSTPLEQVRQNFTTVHSGEALALHGVDGRGGMKGCTGS